MTEQIARRPLFLAACAGMFVFGIVLALLGTLFGLPAMRDRLGVNLAQQGNLFLLLFLGVLAATMVAGLLLDRFGKKPVLSAATLLVAVALGGFSGAQSFRTAAVSAMVLGLGGGALNTAANVLVSDLYDAERGAVLNILGISYGIGALAIPLLAASITEWFTVPQLLIGAAVLAALVTAAFLLLRFPPAHEAQRISVHGLLEMARDPGVLLLAVLLFFQSGNEASIGGWTSSYIGALGENERTATWVLAGYWAALMAGRLLAARLLRRLGKIELVLVSGIGSVMGCAVLLFAGSLAGMAASVAVIGLSFAAIYPTTLAIAGDRYRPYSGSVFALLFAIGILGGTAFPWAIGHIGNSFGMRSGMMLPLGNTAMICILAAAIRAQAKRNHFAR